MWISLCNCIAFEWERNWKTKTTLSVRRPSISCQDYEKFLSFCEGQESGQNAPRRLELNEINQYARTRIVLSNRDQCFDAFLRAFAAFWTLRQEACVGEFLIWSAGSTLSFQKLVDHSSTCRFLSEWKSAYRLSNFVLFTSKSKRLCCRSITWKLLCLWLYTERSRLGNDHECIVTIGSDVSFVTRDPWHH